MGRLGCLFLLLLPVLFLVPEIALRIWIGFLFATFALLTSWGFIGDFRRQTQAQKKRNRHAQVVLSDPKVSRGRYVLYLRAFYLDERPSAPAERLTFSGLRAEEDASGLFGIGAEFSNYVEASIKTAFGQIPLLGLAGHFDFFGPAQIRIGGADWHEKVATLCTHAKAIIYIVGGSSGLDWELEHIVSSNHLSKTIFVIPPFALLEKQYGYQGSRVDIFEARDIFGRLGIPLPKPNFSGRVFTVHPRTYDVSQWDIVSLSRRDRTLASALYSVRTIEDGVEEI